MPELPVKEVRLPELHLPEINREQIIRSLSEMRWPAAEVPKVERPGPGARIDWRAIAPASIDIGRAVTGMAAVARIGRPVLRRSRITVAVGAVMVIGLAAAALLSRPVVRERAGQAARDIRGRVVVRTGSADRLEVDEDLIPGVSDTASEAVGVMDPIEPVGVETPPVAEEAPSPV